jgi:Domain of unknown function (DUF1854)
MIMTAQSPFTLHRDAAGRLVLTRGRGEVHVGVEPVRSFPISEPQRWISLVDGHGKELAAIDDLADVSAETRELIVQELADREFLPRIERVMRVATNKEPHVWDVLTDRGPVQFLLRDDDDIRRLGPHRAILVDMHGVRYYIPDSRQLDVKSQRILSQYL